LFAGMQVAELHLWRRRRDENGEASYLAAVVREKRSLLGERLLDANRTLLPLADATHARACAAWCARRRGTPEAVAASRASAGAVLACVDEYGEPILIPADVPAAAVDCLQAITKVGVRLCLPQDRLLSSDVPHAELPCWVCLQRLSRTLSPYRSSQGASLALFLAD
jgi:hypothetical protein